VTTTTPLGTATAALLGAATAFATLPGAVTTTAFATLPGLVTTTAFATLA